MKTLTVFPFCDILIGNSLAISSFRYPIKRRESNCFYISSSKEGQHMNQHEFEQLAELFKIFGTPTRLQILYALLDQENASTTSPMNLICHRALFPTNSVYSNKPVWSRTAGKERPSITLFSTLMFSQLLPRDLTIFGNKLISFRNLQLYCLRP